MSLYNWNMEIRIGIRKRKLRKTFFLILFHLEGLEEDFWLLIVLNSQKCYTIDESANIGGFKE